MIGNGFKDLANSNQGNIMGYAMSDIVQFDDEDKYNEFMAHIKNLGFHKTDIRQTRSKNCMTISTSTYKSDTCEDYYYQIKESSYNAKVIKWVKIAI